MKRRSACLLALLALTEATRPPEPWTLERALDYALSHNPHARIAQQ